MLDDLNTHAKGAFYAAFEPERARELVRRIKFCYTPQHASWPNIAGCELSAMTCQCLSGHGIGALSELRARGRGLVNQCQRAPARSGMADEDRRRSLQAQGPLPENHSVTDHLFSSITR